MSETENHLNDLDNKNDNISRITYKCEKCEKTYKDKYRYKHHSCKKDDEAIINSLNNSICSRIKDKSLKIRLIEKIMKSAGIRKSDITPVFSSRGTKHLLDFLE